VARRKLGFWRRITAIIVKPSMLLLTKSTWVGLDNLPRQGGVIILANHISDFDPLVISHFLYDGHRWPCFMAKSSLFGIPVFGKYLKAVGQVPVSRGTTDAAKALDAAVASLERGESVIIYPEGTTSKEPDNWPMKGKTGVARLWLRTGRPVVPVVTYGAQKIVEPKTKKFHFGLRVPVQATAMPPMDLSKWAGAKPTTQTLNEITEHMMLHVRDVLAEMRGETPPPLFDPKAGASS
jgi:1-acyl-sn-glycerol-3-phosphate acyltransferase